MAVFTAALIVAAIAGLRTAPSEALYDARRSTFLTGPEGAKGLAQALEAVGVPVERRQRPLYGVAADSARPDSTAWLALLGLSPQPVETGRLFPDTREVSQAERRELMRYLKRGGALLLAGSSGVEECFGMDVTRVRHGGDGESQVVGPPGSDSLPAARYAWQTADPEEGSGECTAPAVLTSRLLLRTADGEAVVWRHLLKGGGRVILMADSRYLSNRFMRDTEAGPLVLRWLLDEAPSRVIVDEYHQGFGVGGSILGAAWAWTRRSPGGWAMLQLALAGLIALAVAAVRFGPALRVVERRRRSPLEHLDALAVGLERSEGDVASVRLIAGGLRRRLSRTGHVPRRGVDDMQWLDALGLAAQSAEARRAVKRLGRVLRERDGAGRVLDAATAVEDVWQALRPAESYRKS
jgi:hypothetical protein